MTGIPRNKRGGRNSPAVMAQRKLSRAVVEARAPGTVEADGAQEALWRALDWFATPPWASRAGAEIVRLVDRQARHVWEPACGDGIMAEALREYFPSVLASDCHDYGYKPAEIVDFLAREPDQRVDWVITNPPFKSAADFVRQGLKVSGQGVAVLCRSVFLESADRYKLLHEGAARLAWVAPFSERVPMQLGPWNPTLSSATAYSWFGFMHPAARVLAGISDRAVIIPIPPGTRARLTRADDAKRFGIKGSTPLLETGSLDESPRITA